MDSKKSFGKKLEHFIAGKGFYIALALCAAIIGVSVWSLLRGAETMTPDNEDTVGTALSEAVPTPALPPAETPALADPTPAMAERDDAAEPEDETTPEEAEDAPAAETAAEQIYVWPVDGDPIRPYSVEALLYDQTMSDWRTHDGVDLAAEVGTKVSAMTSGTVTAVYYDDRYGTTVIIDHGNGLICTYANLEELPTVYVGDAVSAGDTIGSVGATAACESAQESHLHVSAACNGVTVSPLAYLPQKN